MDCTHVTAVQCPPALAWLRHQSVRRALLPFTAAALKLASVALIGLLELSLLELELTIEGEQLGLAERSLLEPGRFELDLKRPPRSEPRARAARYSV